MKNYSIAAYDNALEKVKTLNKTQQDLFWRALEPDTAKVADAKKDFFASMKPDAKVSHIQEGTFTLLRVFDALCKKHGLSYFIYGGGVIGAMRHKGFIPWDDDVDILMPREDFYRFWEMVNDDILPGFYMRPLLKVYKSIPGTYGFSYSLRSVDHGSGGFKCFLEFNMLCKVDEVSEKVASEIIATRKELGKTIVKDFFNNEYQDKKTRYAASLEFIRKDLDSIYDGLFFKSGNHVGYSTHIGSRAATPRFHTLRTEDVFPAHKMELNGVEFDFLHSAVENTETRFGDIYYLPNDITSHNHGVDKGYENWSGILSEYIQKTNEEMGWNK
ncbi:MAG: LicD family protein [Oscillospiraceae bacterium]|nr:LicD family protein [Oscillospiraceae bacterium]